MVPTTAHIIICQLQFKSLLYEVLAVLLNCGTIHLHFACSVSYLQYRMYILALLSWQLAESITIYRHIVALFTKGEVI